MEKKKIGLLCEAFDQFASLEEKNWKIGYNAGNILFFNALHEIVDCHVVSGWNKEVLRMQDAIITTELIWIQEGVKPSQNSIYWLETLQMPLVPISVGLQCEQTKPDFRLTPEMQTLLAAIQERAIIGVRGEYTASILNKHGIKNFEIVGCPSVYQLPLYQNGLEFLFAERTRNSTTANYKTFVAPFREADAAMLHYIANISAGFAEQTLNKLADTPWREEPFAQWFADNSYLFFDLESWVRYNARYDFSFGLRFHGNVAAILAGARALFVTSDSRTKEMSDYFRLPSLGIDQFNTTKDINYYYNNTDYSSFRSVYRTKINKFLGFLASNGLAPTQTYLNRLEKFKF